MASLDFALGRASGRGPNETGLGVALVGTLGVALDAASETTKAFSEGGTSPSQRPTLSDPIPRALTMVQFLRCQILPVRLRVHSEDTFGAIAFGATSRPSSAGYCCP